MTNIALHILIITIVAVSTTTCGVQVLKGICYGGEPRWFRVISTLALTALGGLAGHDLYELLVMAMSR